MSKLVLFDGNAVMHRAYHALPDLKTRAGEPINAVYGLVSMLLKVIEDLKPTHIAFAFDRKEPTFRTQILESYQAQRPEMDEELDSQFDKARETVEAFGIPIYSKAGFEADDVIGTIANSVSSSRLPARAGKLGYIQIDSGSQSGMTDGVSQVLVVTGDRDMLQLVRGKVKLYMPVKGLADAKEFGKDETIERMGVPPEQIVDYKALVGDPSDNYKGVPGIGPKTAIDLLSKYKTLDEIYAHLDEIKESVRKKLTESKDSAYQSQKLARIVIDVDVDFSLEETKKWRLDSPEILSLFEQYGFRTLTKRVKELGKSIASENQMSLL